MIAFFLPIDNFRFLVGQIEEMHFRLQGQSIETNTIEIHSSEAGVFWGADDFIVFGALGV